MKFTLVIIRSPNVNPRIVISVTFLFSLLVTNCNWHVALFWVSRARIIRLFLHGSRVLYLSQHDNKGNKSACKRVKQFVCCDRSFVVNNFRRGARKPYVIRF